MRRSDVAYVQNPAVYHPPVDYKKLPLKELVDKYIKMCGKANGQVSVCSKCQSPCEYGKRAVQLLSNEVYNDPPIPLYGGKTLIERAKEENMLRRQKKEEEEKKMKRHSTRSLVTDDNWYENSLASGDQTKWLMSNYGLSKTQAKKKIYNYRQNHPDKVAAAQKAEEPAKEAVQEPVREITEEPVVVEKKSNDLLVLTMEQKMAELMKEQEDYKALMEKYTKLYYEAKEKVDVLCKAMDMFN